MLNWIVPIATTILGSQLNKGNSRPKAPERMNYNQAYNQALAALEPGYNNNVSKTMQNVDNNLMNRGFYGQAAGDALKLDTRADLYNDFQGRVANYANNLQNNQFSQDMQTYQYELQNDKEDNQFWNSLGSMAGQFMGGPGGEAAFKWLTNSWNNGSGGGQVRDLTQFGR